MERFPLKGYWATSVGDILRGSRHSKGGSYFHFESKEEFFLAVMTRRGQMMEQWWAQLGPEFESLEAALEEAGSWIASSEALPDTLMLSEFRFAVRDKPALVARRGELYEDWMGNLTVFIDTLAGQGLVRTDRTTRELAESVYHVTDGTVVHGAVFGASQAWRTGDVARVLRP